jgi:hypothetical protein
MVPFALPCCLPVPILYAVAPCPNPIDTVNIKAQSSLSQYPGKTLSISKLPLNAPIDAHLKIKLQKSKPNKPINAHPQDNMDLFSTATF